eukprot:261477-Prymnesium_polylepis.2
MPQGTGARDAGRRAHSELAQAVAYARAWVQAAALRGGVAVGGARTAAYGCDDAMPHGAHAEGNAEARRTHQPPLGVRVATRV